jgi:phosphate transport system substrate-binding protein
MSNPLLRSAVLATVVATASLATQAQDVTGAGASFPAPVYAKWADAYHKATGARVNYPDRLQVGVRVVADDDVGPGRGDHDPADALQGRRILHL